MTQEELNGLRTGDVVRQTTSNEPFVVTGNYGGRATAAKTADVTNPCEWVLVAKAKHSAA